MPARQSSWRGEGEDERTGPPERGGRTGWQEVSRGGTTARKSWDEDHLPEWVNEHPLESGGTFDDRGAFHGSEDEQVKMDSDSLQRWMFTFFYVHFV